jgi:hypothetical protein
MIPDFRNAFTKASTRLSLTRCRTRSDPVKARLDIGIQDPPVAHSAVVVDIGDGVVCSPVGPKPVRDRFEVCLEDGFQHYFQRCLDDPIRHCRYPEPTQLARRLRDHPFPHRQRHKLPCLQLVVDLTQKRFHSARARPEAVDGSTIHPGVRAPRLPATRANASCNVAGSYTKLYKSSNRPVTVSHRPPVQFGLHPPYP